MRKLVKFITLIFGSWVLLSADVMINEVNFYPETWVEIYNPASCNIDLSDYKLVTPSGAINLEGIEIAPNSYIILSRERLFPHNDFVVNIELSNSGGYILLMRGSAVVDFVNWGILSSDWKNSYPFLWDDAPVADMNLARIPDGHDTDRPQDFRNTETPTPISPNTTMGLDPVSWSRIKALFRDAHKRM